MKPESLRAYTQLQSFGMEELSSEDAAQLLSLVDECPECHGEWVLFYETINTLSHAANDEVTSDRSEHMWLVCLEHAKQRHTFSISSEQELDSVPESHSEAERELAGQKKTEKFLSSDSALQLDDANKLEKLWGPRYKEAEGFSGASTHSTFLSPRSAFGLAMVSVAILAATYFLTPQSAGSRQASTALPATLTVTSPSQAEIMSPENTQLAAYATHSNLYMEPLSDSVAPQLVSHSMNSGSR